MNDADPVSTMAQILRRNARVWPQVEAAVDGTRRLTWLELLGRAESTCARFSEQGVRRGDRVAVVLPNQLEALVLYWACALSGAIFVGANPRLGRDDLQALVTHSGTRIAYVAESVDASGFSRDVRVIVVSEQMDPASPFGQRGPLDEHAFPRIEPSDTFAIVYTSGTTGPPKGALLSHENLVRTAAATIKALAVTDRDVVLMSVQLTHIFGLSATVLLAALAGARLVMMREHAAGHALDLIEWERVSVHHGSPTMFVLELAAQRRAPRDLSSLRTGIVAAAPAAPAIVDAIREELHCNVEIAWGLTETSPTVTITQPSDPPDERRASVGKPLPFASLRIVEMGGEYGEIAVKSPGVFQGYYRDEATTASVMTADGFFLTGDLGWLDDRGFLHLAGRRKDLIIRAGLHVYPDELEEVLRTLPWVAAVAVVGLPDRLLGEKTCACVVAEREVEMPVDALMAARAAVTGRLADYKMPDSLVWVDELPRSAAGKILRHVLRDDAVARLGA